MLIVCNCFNSIEINIQLDCNSQRGRRKRDEFNKRNSVCTRGKTKIKREESQIMKSGKICASLNTKIRKTRRAVSGAEKMEDFFKF